MAGTMSTCACCGQALPAQGNARLEDPSGGQRHAALAATEVSDEKPAESVGRLLVQVDDDLLSLCNQAYEVAQNAGAGGVEIAHLIWCITRGGLAERHFEREGFPRSVLEAAAEAWIRGCPAGASGEAIQTSHDLKLLLARAERIAIAGGRRFAGEADVLAALARDAGDLRSARLDGNRSQRFAEAGDVASATVHRPTSWHAMSSGGFQDRAATHLAPEPEREPEPDSFERISDAGHDAGAAACRSSVTERVGSRGGGRRQSHRSALHFAVWSDRTPVRLVRRGQCPPETVARLHAPEFATERAALMERLLRQEQLVAELSSLVGRLVDHRDGSSGGPVPDGAQGDTKAPANRGGPSGERSGPTPTMSAQRSRSSSAIRSTSPGKAAANAEQRRGSSQGQSQRQSQSPSPSQSQRRSGDRDREPRSAGHWDRSRLRRRSTDWRVCDRYDDDREAYDDVPVSRAQSRGRPEPQQREAHPRYRAMRGIGGGFGQGVGDGFALPADNDVDDDDTTGERPKRFYLSPDDEIVKAPSIGPRTAERLNPVGLVLVRDLLRCDPVATAARADNRYITADRIACWKAQARLVCTIPWLRGTHAQLLVGAGYDTLNKLIRADTTVVCAGILRFAATREGQSILRTGPPPEIDRIACWIENAALAEPARAA